MFSRGNITEKIRFGKLVQKGDVVLDMYGGIGYFTLPALIHGGAKHVFSCEWNEHAVEALRFNLADNGVDDRATVLVGDCRVSAKNHKLVDMFDRVSLGLLPSSEGGWQTAVRALRRSVGGWLHVHGNVPVKESRHWCKWLCIRLLQYARDEGLEWVVILTHLEKVKSFAPTVNHYVADVFVGPRGKTNIVDKLEDDSAVLAMEGEALEVCLESLELPTCALSLSGVINQTWMR
jgi:tRNA G37 N-methylase Trm5